MTDDTRKIPLSFLGARLTGSRLSADSYLDLLAIVMLVTPSEPPTVMDRHTLLQMFMRKCEVYQQAPDQVCARVALMMGGCVPEVEEP